MKKSIFALGLALLVGCAQPDVRPATGQSTAPAQAFAPSQVSRDKVSRYVSNQLVVKLTPEQEAEFTAQGWRVLARLPELSLSLFELPGGTSALAAAQKLNLSGTVGYAAPNRLRTGEPRVSHPLTGAGLGEQATGRIFDQLAQYALDDNHMAAQAAWNAGLTGKGVLVGVIDDPVDVTHPDLRPNWASRAFDPVENQTYTTAQTWIDHIDGQDGEVDQKIDPNDEHGTAVTSSLLAVKDGKGMVGVAPEAKFVNASIFQPDSVSDFYVARAIVWATNQGVRVLNNSYGSGGYSDPIKDALDYALEKGVSIVASAGNDGRQYFNAPAQFPGVMTSAALNINNTRASFSNSSSTVSTAAPGVDVLTAAPLWLNADGSRKEGATPQGNTGYQWASGTSFSGPLTAGAAALVLGKRPDLDPYQVRRLLEETADGRVGSNPAGYDLDTGYGLIRLDRLAARLANGPIPEKGGAAKVLVQIQTESGYQPSPFADVLLERDAPDANSAPLVYAARTDAQGYASFVAIAPGTYRLLVGTPDLAITGDNPEQRETYSGSLTVTAGSVIGNVAPQRVLFTKGAVDLNPLDPYEPNDSLETATPLTPGTLTQTAYIFGKERDVDFYRFEGKAGEIVDAQVYARNRIGGLLDACLVLRGSAGEVLTLNDDAASIGPDPAITGFALPADGRYYLEVGSNQTLCLIDPDDISQGLPDDSPFNKYRLELRKR
ncbi:S8 family serine peptidase [Deinococcus sp. VB343]|uniref:S8 family serine peptidase n=1 Tax=Deinococcus sp. VB343 TaxID=3385567 RepID=UPI0039C97868